MKWQNLKQNKCPRCGKDFALVMPSQTPLLNCSCGFKIGYARFEEITTSQAKQSVDSYFKQRGEQHLYDDEP
jgi:DNA-directed RNA polymerase subunit RPC12/RpoP